MRVVVRPNVITRIEIEPAVVHLAPGQTQTFEARGFDEYGNEGDPTFRWHTVGQIGTITVLTGLFTAVGPGEGNVIAVTNRGNLIADAGADVQGSSKVIVAGELPEVTALYPNYPNPFNATTRLRYDLPIALQVRLSIYNLAGQEVRQLIASHQEAGIYQAEWDGKDQRGLEMSSGTYLVRLQAGSYVQIRKVLLLR